MIIATGYVAAALGIFGVLKFFYHLLFGCYFNKSDGMLSALVMVIIAYCWIAAIGDLYTP